MAAESENFLGRVSKSDFFAILGSGIYVVAVCLFLTAAVWQPTSSFDQDLIWLIGMLEGHWVVVAGLMYLSFMVGSVLRALRVNLADGYCRRWVRRARGLLYRTRHAVPKGLFGVRRPGKWWLSFVRHRKRRTFDRILDRTPFPYLCLLEGQSRAMEEHVPQKVELPTKEAAHLMFNFWKATLCGKNDPNFAFTQDQEARVRLFANMFWAGLLSLFPSTIGMVVGLVRFGSGWFPTMLIVFCFSVSICAIFDSQIRRVRGQEVLIVFLAYVALQVDSNETADD